MELQYNTISTIVFIVLLIVPGVIFKRFYFQGQFTKQFGTGPFADRIITSVFWGLFVQFVSFLLYSKICNFTYAGIQSKINDAYQKVVQNQIPSFDSTHIGYILGYLFFLIFIAAALGTVCHFIVRICKLDVKYAVFRFSNKWNYMIKGDILSTREFKGLKKGKVSGTEIDIVIEDGKESVKMIRGILIDYTISEKTGELETIYITGAEKYIRNENGEGGFKEIPGVYMVVPCHRMVDMNIRYIFKVSEEQKAAPAASNKIIGRLYLAGQFIILIAPAYLNLPTLNKLLSVLFTSLFWIFLLATISALLPTTPDKRTKPVTIVILLIIAIVCGLVMLSELKLVKIFTY